MALPTAFSRAASLPDKLRVARLKARLQKMDTHALWQLPESDTRSFLRAEGFSERFVDRFFRPFYGGIFLERPLATSARMFAFVFKMFAEGRATLPRDGIGALANDLAARLPSETVRFESPVRAIAPDAVTLADGTELPAAAVIQTVGLSPSAPGPTSVCAWFAAHSPPFREGLILLNGGAGLINHVAVPSNVQRSYAPDGQHLIGVNVVEPESSQAALTAGAVQAAAREFLGAQVDFWRLLRFDRVSRSLPVQTRVTDPHLASVRDETGIFHAGDRLANGSVEAALVTGKRAAEAILSEVPV